MVLLNASNIKKMFGDETLFEGVSFQIDENDKIGFIGENGAGKSTLFKILTGELEYDFGELFKNKLLKIGYLEQHSCANSEKTVMEEFLSVFDEIINIEHELDDIRLDLEMGNGDMNTLISRQHSLNERFVALDGAYYKSKIRAALLGLGFSQEDFDKKTSTLSGGQKTRVELGKILLSDVNLLLLDEPTNHLDIDSVNWLEEFLRSYKGAFVVISHDRYFLDRVTNKTFSLEGAKLYSMNGNYSAFNAQMEIERKSREREYENTRREIERLEGIVEQQKRWNREKNIKTAESKMKVIERLEEKIDKPTEKGPEFKFGFRAVSSGGNDVIMTENLEKSFGDNKVFRGVNTHIVKGERVFLLGPNGCGKTTFLKILMGQCTPDDGEYKIGANIHIGYYDQIQENLNMQKTVIDEVWDEFPALTQTDIRNALAAFLFRGEDVFKEISKLSGGERARVELAKLMLKKHNLLILDEPTNHLDIAAREALEQALDGYDGTILAVSHDRYFINKLSTRILHMESDGVTNYIGGYDDYAEKRKNFAVQTKTVQVKQNDYQQQKRAAAQKRKVKNLFERTENSIAELEKKINDLTIQLEQPEISQDYVKAMEIANQTEELNGQLEKLYEDWERLQLEMEEFE